jgi:hypothetical protein
MTWEKKVALEGLVAGKFSPFAFTWARTKPLNWEVPPSMFQARTRVVEGPKTVVYATIEILLGIL